MDRRVLIVGAGPVSMGYVMGIVGRSCGNVVIATKQKPNATLDEGVYGLYAEAMDLDILQMENLPPAKTDRHFNGRKVKHWER